MRRPHTTYHTNLADLHHTHTQHTQHTSHTSPILVYSGIFLRAAIMGSTAYSGALRWMSAGDFFLGLFFFACYTTPPTQTPNPNTTPHGHEARQNAPQPRILESHNSTPILCVEGAWIGFCGRYTPP